MAVLTNPAKPRSDSPRFSLRDSDFSELEKALDSTGHVVLDDVWRGRYLRKLADSSERRFNWEDTTYSGKFDQLPRVTVDTYLAGCSSIEACALATGQTAEDVDAEFYMELERSGLPALYRFLLRGDFISSRNERVIRRVDPRFPLRFAGIHCDGQLLACSKHALRSKREVTLWTPLLDCSADDTPRLLLVHRGESPYVFDDSEKVSIKGVSVHPIQLRPYQIAEDEPDALGLAEKTERQYAKLFQAVRCYAPPIPLGSAILFDRDIWHGSYFLPGMTKPRFSLDFRCVGEYQTSAENRGYTGWIFRQARFPRP